MQRYTCPRQEVKVPRSMLASVAIAAQGGTSRRFHEQQNQARQIFSCAFPTSEAAANAQRHLRSSRQTPSGNNSGGESQWNGINNIGLQTPISVGSAGGGSVPKLGGAGARESGTPIAVSGLVMLQQQMQRQQQINNQFRSQLLLQQQQQQEAPPAPSSGRGRPSAGPPVVTLRPRRNQVSPFGGYGGYSGARNGDHGGEGGRGRGGGPIGVGPGAVSYQVGGLLLTSTFSFASVEHPRCCPRSLYPPTSNDQVEPTEILCEERDEPDCNM